MAVKKKAKKKTTQSAKVAGALQSAEKKMLENYRKVASMSGEDWKKVHTKYKAKVKKDLAGAKKKIDSQVRKNPERAVLAAGVIGAIAGAILMSKLKKK